MNCCIVFCQCYLFFGKKTKWFACLYLLFFFCFFVVLFIFVLFCVFHLFQKKGEKRDTTKTPKNKNAEESDHLPASPVVFTNPVPIFGLGLKNNSCWTMLYNEWCWHISKNKNQYGPQMSTCSSQNWSKLESKIGLSCRAT